MERRSQDDTPQGRIANLPSLFSDLDDRSKTMTNPSVERLSIDPLPADWILRYHFHG
jgi:hypothetical protein